MSETEITGRVLVVDDERDIVEVLTYLLSKAGYDVVSASNGRSALDAVRAGGIDLVLLDYMLPDMTGLDVLKESKAVSPGTSVIIITGRGTDKVLADVLEAGASAYVVKPFLNEHLLDLIRKNIAK